MGESIAHKKILTTRRLNEFSLPKFTAVHNCDDDDDKGSVRGWQKLVFALPHPQMFIFLSRSQNVTNFPLFSLSFFLFIFPQNSHDINKSLEP
jgi:hypothetical protein